MVDRTAADSAFCRAICRTSICTVESRCSRKSRLGLDNGGNAVPLGWVPAAARSQYPTCGFGPAWKVFDGCAGGLPPTVMPCTLLVPVTVFGCVSRAIGVFTEVRGFGLGRLGNSGLVGFELSRTPDPRWRGSCFVKGVYPDKAAIVVLWEVIPPPPCTTFFCGEKEKVPWVGSSSGLSVLRRAKCRSSGSA